MNDEPEVEVWRCPDCWHSWAMHRIDGVVSPCWALVGVHADGKDWLCECASPPPARLDPEGLFW
jgi:hypothetical protein